MKEETLKNYHIGLECRMGMKMREKNCYMFSSNWSYFYPTLPVCFFLTQQVNYTNSCSHFY